MRNSTFVTTIERWSAGIGTLTILVAGFLIATWPLFQNGLGRAPGDLGDGRFIHYLLEHSWQWISGNPNNPLWSPPFYYPIENTAAFSDLMAGAGPIYWAIRLAGVSPQLAYALWIPACIILNLLTAWLVLHWGLKFSPLAAATGAAFLACASPLLNQFIHPQFVPQFFVLAILLGFLILFHENNSRLRVSGAVLLISLGFVLQMYTAFYYAWFSVWGLSIAAILASIHPETRSKLLSVIRQSWLPLGLGCVFTVTALIPWASHYLDAAKTNPTLTYEEIHGWIPRWQSWLYMGPDNLLYAWNTDWPRFVAIPDWSEHEHRLGVGVITLSVLIAGHLFNLRRPWVQISAITATLLVLATTIFPGQFNAWEYLFEILPGAPAARTLTRIALIVLIPMAIGIALFVDRLKSGHRYLKVALILAIPAVLTEQVTEYQTFDTTYAISRSMDIEEGIPENCVSFLYSPTTENAFTPDYVVQLDAMWAGLIAGTPTVNAYGHIVPDNWGFGEPVILSSADRERLQVAREIWQASHPDVAPICVTQQPSVP